MWACVNILSRLFVFFQCYVQYTHSTQANLAVTGSDLCTKDAQQRLDESVLGTKGRPRVGEYMHVFCGAQIFCFSQKKLIVLRTPYA